MDREKVDLDVACHRGGRQPWESFSVELMLSRPRKISLSVFSTSCPSSLLYLCQMFLQQYVLDGGFFQPHVTASNRSADVLLRLTCDAVNGEPPTRGVDIIHTSCVLDTHTCTVGVPLCSYSAAAQSCLSCTSRAVHYTTVVHQGRSVQNLLIYQFVHLRGFSWEKCVRVCVEVGIARGELALWAVIPASPNLNSNNNPWLGDAQ